VNLIILTLKNVFFHSPGEILGFHVGEDDDDLLGFGAA
jgi:hypothetical protein